MSWGIGRYEDIAPTLLPAAQAAVARSGVVPGQRVLDLGCGSGNASELLARAGAHLTCVDPEPRLLEVARHRLADQGLAGDFLSGEAGQLPMQDASVDLVVSVFAMIFAPDPQRAVAEASRVLARPGRLVLTAWIPTGALFDVMRDRRLALEHATGAVPAAAPFAWHEPEALAGLLGPHGYDVNLETLDLAFTAASPEAFVDAEFRDHPMWVLAQSVLEPRGEWEALQARARQTFSAANEAPGAFRSTSRYVVITASRD